MTTPRTIKISLGRVSSDEEVEIARYEDGLWHSPHPLMIAYLRSLCMNGLEGLDSLMLEIEDSEDDDAA